MASDLKLSCGSRRDFPGMQEAPGPSAQQMQWEKKTGGRCVGSRVFQACGYSSISSLRTTVTELVAYSSLSFTMFTLSPVVIEATDSVMSPEAHEYNLGIHKRF